MTVTLTPEQEKFIAERMDKGGYSSPEKVLAEGLKLIQVKEEYERRREELKRELQIGIDQISRGELVDGRKVFEEILEKNSQRPRHNT
jgi:antitoxin ParD1/3/4